MGENVEDGREWKSVEEGTEAWRWRGIFVNLHEIDFFARLLMFDFLKRKPKGVPQLFFKTDMHCHLVPGIDDGQRDAVSAADLVAHEKGWGVEKIFCTPHITQDTFENTPEVIAGAFGKLSAAVSAAGVEMGLDYSAEHRLDGFFLSQLEAGAIRPLPNDYLLVENSYVQEAWNMDQMLFDLKLKGFKPILAHPERYSYYFDKRQRYAQLHGSGTLFQVNLLSLAGYYGKEVRQAAECLVDMGFVDFVGTDMHNHRHCEAIEKYLGTKDYRRHAEVLEGRILNDKAFV